MVGTGALARHAAPSGSRWHPKMPNRSQFLIQFDRPDDFFYTPGMTVSGNVVLSLVEPYAARCIRAVFLGRAHVEWMESDGGSARSFSDDEVLFEESATLWGDRQGPERYLPVGEHAFKFAFRIPTYRPLPGSFKSRYGRVQYLVRVHIDRPAFFFTKTMEKEFKMPLPPFDMKLDSRVAKPQMISDQKTVCCWCCAAGQIDVMVRLPRTGFAYGEVITLSAEISNHSYIVIEKVTMQLVQNFKVTVHPGPSETTHMETTVLVSVLKREPIRRGGKQRWENEGITVPPPDKAPATLERPRCKLLEITYFIKFIITPRGYCCDFDVTVPIIIGTAPVQDSSPAASVPAYPMTSGGSASSSGSPITGII